MQEYNVVNMEDVQELEHSSSFETQFRNRQELNPAEGRFRYIDIKPEGLPDGSPLIFVPGWSITLDTEKQLLEDLHSAGKHTVSLEFPRFGGEVQKQANMPREVVRQAEMINELIKLRPEDKVDVVAQSMGVMDLITAVKLHPELLDRIGRVVFVSPAGITGNDNFFKLLSRFGPHLAQDVATALHSSNSRENIFRMMKESNIYITKNPLRAVVGEAVAIAGSDMYEGLKDFQNAGIKVGIIQAEHDKLTPAKKLWSKIGEGSDPVSITLTQEEYEREKEQYDKWNIKPGQKVFNRHLNNQVPPFDQITMVGGGHDNRIYSEPGFSKKILHQLSTL